MAKAKAASKAKAKVEPKAKVVKEKLPPLEEQNGVKKPRDPESQTGQVWAMADSLARKVKGQKDLVIPTIAVMLEELPDVNVATVKTQYSCWRKFHGHDAVWRGEKKEDKKDKKAA